MMMAGEMFGATTLHPGSKRRAEEPEVDQPITKRLARMRIGQEKQEALQDRPLTSYLDRSHLQPSVSSPEPAAGGYSKDDQMNLDDTKDTLYIHDLESEIAQIEAEEPKGIFLPDIDKKISAIPQQLLQNQTNNANTQMVLYQVPSSISVPEEQDHVRKAIIATRARAREQQARDAGGNKNEGYVTYENRVNGLVPGEVGQKMEEDDPDAMELG